LLNRLGIRGKILSILVVPLIAMFGFGAYLMSEKWQVWDDASDLKHLASVSPIIGLMVHEMQIERGLSAGFLGSKGAPKFQARLAEQRKKVDAAQVELLSVFDELDGGGFRKVLHATIDRSQAQLNDLGNQRGRVSSQALNVGEMAGYYTGTIRNLLSLIELANLLTTESESGRTMTAYIALLHSKERAGLERAMGANGFGKGEFAPGIHRRFIDLIGQQRAFNDVFRAQASEEQIAMFDESQNGPVADEVNRMRELAIGKLVQSDLGGVTGPQWFDAITKKIDQLHDIELRMAGDLVGHAGDVEAHATTAVLLGGVLMAGAFALTIAFGLFHCIRLVRPISAIRACVSELAAGKNVEVPATNRGDEIGDLARSLDQVYQRGLEAARLRTALDASQTLVMVANRRLEVVYANPALVTKLQTYQADIRQKVSGFSPDELIGTKVDTFINGSAEKLGSLETLTSSVETRLNFNDIRFELSVSPINRDGSFLGVIVEWRDKTGEEHAIAEIEAVMAAANKGDFSGRVDAKGVTGVLGSFANGINQLASLVESAITDLGRMFGAVADGDLTQRLDGKYEGALGELQQNANRTAERLSTIVADIQSVAEQVSSAAGEIDSGTEDLSRRTEKAASSLEETAAATEEMSATVSRNAENAGNANDLATEANRAAGDGGDVVQRVVTAMSDIKSSTNQMTDTISVIDEIAFQTNLLALNASVEAARAGEAGKGFAVVAQEVRALAQRSATAASDIKGLIKDSNDQVQSGVKLVNQAGEALSDIVGSIGKVADIVHEISSASKEQAIGIQEISSSVNQMDEMTQQNSALVEESAASANTLSDQASQLSDLMRFFKLDPAHLAAKASTPAAVAASPVISSKAPAGLASAKSGDDEGWEDF